MYLKSVNTEPVFLECYGITHNQWKFGSLSLSLSLSLTHSLRYLGSWLYLDLGYTSIFCLITLKYEAPHRNTRAPHHINFWLVFVVTSNCNVLSGVFASLV